MIYTLMFGSYTFPNQTFEVESLPLVNNIKQNTVPRRHGSIIQDPYLKARKIKVKGTIHNATRATAWTEFMDMQEALLASEDKFYHRADRYVNCCCNKITPKFAEGTDKGVININIDFISQDPFFYMAAASYSDVNNPVGVTLSFNINGLGNVFAEPIIYICATGGTITDEIQLENQTTKELFVFNGVVNNGVTLEIDTKDFTVENNAVDGISEFGGDFLTVAAGSNLFRFVGATCRVTVEHKSRWY